MKRNVLALFAVVLAIAVSSFTTPRVTFRYLVYDGINTEKDIASYSQSTSLPSHGYSSISPAKLNWFRATDANDNGLSQIEFEDSFESYDLINSSSDLLKDEAQDVQDQLDLQNKILP